MSHFGTTVLLLGLLSPASHACDFPGDCAQLREAVNEFYDRAVQLRLFRSSESLNLSPGGNRFYFNEDVIHAFLYDNQQLIERVISQGDTANREAERLIRQFGRESTSGATPSHLNELADKIDVAVKKSNQIWKLLNDWHLQGHQGGMVGNGLLWPDNVPANLRHLSEDATKLQYMSYDHVRELLGGSDHKMAQLVEKSPEFKAVVNDHLEYLKAKAARERGALATNTEQQIRNIERNVLRMGSAEAEAAATARVASGARALFLKIIEAIR